MKIEAAHTKRCCGRAPENTGRPITIDGETFLACVADQCMSWRWLIGKQTDAFIAHTLVVTRDNPTWTHAKVLQEALKAREQFTLTEGYCGIDGARGASANATDPAGTPGEGRA